MRIVVAVVCLAGCGRVGFETAPFGDATDPFVPPLTVVSPGSLPMFGAPTIVTELSVGGINDDDPCLSRDQLEIYFDSSRSGSNDLWFAQRPTIGDAWSTPVALTELNTSGIEEHPAISADGLTLYYTSAPPAPAMNMSDVWVATRPDRASPWMNPTPVPVNSSVDDDENGSVSALHVVLMFSSRRPAKPTADLYESLRMAPDQPWGPPQLVADLEFGSAENVPHLDDRGLTVFFERTTGGQIDIYWAERAAVGVAWSVPTLVTELATPADDTDPWLSPDLRTIYFVRASGGTKDIYMASR